MFDDTNLRNAHKQAIIIAIAFFFSLVVYAGIAEFFLGNVNIENSFHGILRYILMAVTAMEIVMMIIIRNRILAAEPQAENDTAEIKEKEFIQRLRSAHIISYALCESIAIYGLLLFMLGKDRTEFYAFLGVALFMMMVNFPKYEDWKTRLEYFLSD